MYSKQRRRPRGVLRLEQLERRDCPATVSISGGREVMEGATNVALQVTLSEPLAVRASVVYSTGGSTAQFRNDYTLSPLLSRNRITFLPGETSKTIFVNIRSDTAREPTERVSVSLTAPINCTLGSARTAVTILDDDSYSVAMLGPVGQVNEGSQASFLIQLSSPATKAELFRISAIGESARSGRDFAAFANRMITVPKGTTSAAFSIPIFADGTPEADETFLVRATSALPGTPLPRPVRVTISETTVSPPRISVADATATEGNAGTASVVFAVGLSEASTKTVTIAYTTSDGSATASDQDYVPVSGTLTFAPGEISKSIAVLVRGDAKPELNEAFSLTLSAPVNCTLARPSGEATIVDDDVDQPGFQITVNYIDSVPTVIRDTVAAAVAGWQQVITGDIPSVIDPFTGELVDDIVLDVRVGLLGGATPTGSDGAENTLANAGMIFGGRAGADGTLAIRRQSGLPFHATIGFDPSDFPTNSVTALRLFYTTIHEIGHALGFGQLWNYDPSVGLLPQSGLITGFGTQWPLYVGVNAVREYNAVFGTTGSSMPVENTAIQGTYGLHWNEAIMGAEIMTSVIDSGVKCPFSRITIGAMQDLGYVVNYDAADAYASYGFIEWSQSAGGNGHAYALFNDSVSWPEARRMAESLIPPTGFRRGTLVSINSDAENQFLASWVPSTAWMGFTDEVVDGEWRWIDGSLGIWQDPRWFRYPVQTAYVNWFPGEPTGSSRGFAENYGLFNWIGASWNDGTGPEGGVTYPFVVEFVRL
jgi:hypothetical protein